MPHCGECGFQVTEDRQFCPNCGAPLKTQIPIQPKPAPPARANTLPVLIRSTPFVEGITIGLGAAVLVGCLLGGFFLNTDYMRLHDTFLASGLGPQQISYLLSSTVLLIGFCAEFAILGVFLLIMGTLSHVYPSVRAIMNNGNMRARWGSGLLAAGIVLGASSVQLLVRNMYFPEEFWVWPLTIFGIVSVALILLGLFLIKTSKSQTATAVKTRVHRIFWKLV